LGLVHGKGGLSTEDINGLLRCLPSTDERDMLQRHSARYAELGMAEQFMLTMMSISQVTSLLSIPTSDTAPAVHSSFEIPLRLMLHTERRLSIWQGPIYSLNCIGCWLSRECSPLLT